MRISNRNIIPLIGFVCITFISTWATVESIQRLINLPKVAIWIFSIICLSAVSYGITCIRAAFDNNRMVHGRGKYLALGVFLGLVWFVFILPTNTHTFFYQQEIVSVTVADFNNTRNELTELPKQGVKFFDLQKEKLRDDVVADLANLHQEINDPYNRGHSHKSDSIENVISKKLGGLKAQKPKQPPYLTEAALIAWSNNISENWHKQLDIALSRIDNNRDNFEASINFNNIKILIGRLNNLEHKIYELGEPDAEMKAVLRDGHLEIDHLKEKQEIANSLNKNAPRWLYVTDLENVYVVWVAFINGELKGHGFWFYILGAVVIDFIGFFCYYMAFERPDFS